MSGGRASPSATACSPSSSRRCSTRTRPITRERKQIALDAMLAFKSYLREFVAARRADPGDGVVDHAIAAQTLEDAITWNVRQNLPVTKEPRVP